VILIHQRHRQTDGQTDGQHAISIPRYALVHRAVTSRRKREREFFSRNMRVYWFTAITYC